MAAFVFSVGTTSAGLGRPSGHTGTSSGHALCLQKPCPKSFSRSDLEAKFQRTFHGIRLRCHTFKAERRHPNQPVKILASLSAEDERDRVYEGRFGRFVITDEDRAGVLAYRSSLCVAAAATVIAAGGIDVGVPVPLDVLYATAAAALGVSLATIHIYMIPLHRALQALWAAGVAGTVVLAALNPGSSVVEVMYDSPHTLLLTGWSLVALTGLFVKEAFCFGRAEALVLTALVPVLAGGHFLGVLPPALDKPLFTVAAAAFALFAARKFTQLPGADIGDKSVFEYLKNSNGLE